MESIRPQLTFWEANPKLKNLLVALAFALIFSGIGLALLSEVQTYYRNKLYIDTQSSLPIPTHKIKH